METNDLPKSCVAAEKWESRGGHSFHKQPPIVWPTSRLQAISEGKDIRDIPVVPSAPDPSLVPSPHCGRPYSETAAERHIPRCKDIQAKPKFLSRGSGKGAYARK